MSEIDTSAEAVERKALQCIDSRMPETAATLRALVAERDALQAPRGYSTCAHCGGQNGWIEADMAAEVERRCAAAYADRDRLAARVVELEGALRAALPFVETAERGLQCVVRGGFLARAALAGSARDDR